jgi:hypothetical protein
LEILMSDAKSVEERVQVRAYALWEQDGKPEGRADHHWRQAQSEIEREDAGVSESGSQGQGPAGAKKRKSPKSMDPHPGMMGDGTEEQNLGQQGDPSARITEAEVKDAFKARR